MHVKSMVGLILGVLWAAPGVIFLGLIVVALLRPFDPNNNPQCNRAKEEWNQWWHESIVSWEFDSYGTRYSLLTRAKRDRLNERADAAQSIWTKTGCQGQISGPPY